MTLSSRVYPIVVLDGFALNPGDLSWDDLRKLAPCEIYDHTPGEQVAARLQGASIGLTNKAHLTAATIASLPDLRYIGVTATGTNIVDLASARARGIIVTNVPAYSTDSVAQTTFALLLELTHHAGHHAKTTAEGRWSRSRDFCYWDFPLIELAGLTMGIIGLGAVGRKVAGIATAFGMRVIGASRSGSNDRGIECVSLDEIFRQSDVLSLHCPLTPETKGIVNRERLASMKKTAFLINTGRGPLIDEQALANALNGEQLAGAGLDVLSEEPPSADNPLLRARHCIITPHIAWATRAARVRLMKQTVANLEAFLQGAPINIVN
jgi:glycerate dehydrogenase